MRPIIILTLAGLISLVACNGTAAVGDTSTTMMTASATSTISTGETTASDGRPTATVGAVGCSMTINALDGYRQLGGRELWPPVGLGYGRGSVARWADPELGFWGSFLSGLARYPETDEVWWQLCTSGTPDDDLDAALELLQMIEEATSGSTIFVSAQPAYSDGHVCRSAGPDGPSRMEDLADELVATGRVERGPVLSALSPEQLADSCHANESGVTQMGQEVLDFFGP